MQRKTDRTFARRATVGIVVALLVLIALPATASAARIIKYRGELSTGDTVVASVLRRDNGRLFLRKLGFERLAFTCDEGGGDAIGISWLAYPGRRLDHDRSFAITESDDLVAGTLRWRHGQGTLEMSYAQDGGTCTTGELTWSVERTGWAPDPHSKDPGPWLT